MIPRHAKDLARRLSQGSDAGKSLYSFMATLRQRLTKRMPDEKFAQMAYREATGRRLNLEQPRTFNEKLWWLKLNNRDPLLTVCTDKASARVYVAEKGYSEILVPIVGIYSSPSDIDWPELPPRAFLKTTHGSGTNAYWDQSQPFNFHRVSSKFETSLTRNYYYASREWNYFHAKPQIIVEHALAAPGDGLIDYRLLCFDGKVRLVFVDAGTAAPDGTHAPRATRNVYTPEYKILPLKVKRDHHDPTITPRPANWEKMIKIAEDLSAPFVFCRVDLYNIDGTIYFGEMTFYPGGGNQILTPDDWEVLAGSWIDLSSPKIIRK